MFWTVVWRDPWQEKTSLGGKLFQNDGAVITVPLEFGDNKYEAVITKVKRKGSFAEEREDTSG